MRVLTYDDAIARQAIEVTIQRLIGSGMDPKTENNPYLGFIYTSFQERATKVLWQQILYGIRSTCACASVVLVVLLAQV